MQQLKTFLGPFGRLMARMVALGRYPKRAILVINDVCILTFSMWLAFSIRYNEFYTPPNWRFMALTGLAPAIGVLTFFQMDLYRLVTRYIGGRTINRIALAVCVSILIWSLVVVLTGMTGVPRTAVILYAIFGTLGIWGSRQLAGWILKGMGVDLPRPFAEGRDKVIIYGAGPTGVQLAVALARSQRYDPVGFVDQNRGLWGQYVAGFKVYRPERLAGLVDRHQIKEVLLAMPEASRHERAQLLRSLEKFPVSVRTLPAIEDIATGRVTVSDLRPVGADDLLGRDAVPPNPDLMHRNIQGKSVMVTGAGGSIGSELVRQIVRQRPTRLVLFEASESALYQIGAEVQDLLVALNRDAEDPGTTTKVVPVSIDVHAVLGSVLDEQIIRDTIERHGVVTIYHAAAHKHVPIVENNPTAGLLNNTFGTVVVARAAAALGVERFVFISTDKAVRPTSIMGASKRLAEMFLQSTAAIVAGRTVFTIVRFGNVLDSSGSVVRLFRKQIEAGGPVTVTHPDMIRYFMSIPEAASLVIQAGAMGVGGEVFVLNMGEPVRIDDLARSMIRLMGLSVRDAQNPTAISPSSMSGLRQGEKLREELIIGDSVQWHGTSAHHLVPRADGAGRAAGAGIE